MAGALSIVVDQWLSRLIYQPRIVTQDSTVSDPYFLPGLSIPAIATFGFNHLAGLGYFRVDFRRY
jgi:hypothetical protein